MQKSVLVSVLAILGAFVVLASGCSSGSGPAPTTPVAAPSPTSFAAGVSTLVPAPTEMLPAATDTVAPTAPLVPSPTAEVATPSATTAATSSDTQGTPWVPPTALVGTPIPGAVATLTSAPALKTETIMLINKAGMEYNMAVEIADTPASQGLGLMFRSSMDPNAGMLFDFGGDSNDAFWMENTILPLSVAFIKGDGTIIATLDMKALDRTPVGPSGPYHYALETNQGYFAAHNLQPGDKVVFPAQPSAALPGMPDCSQASASSK